MRFRGSDRGPSGSLCVLVFVIARLLTFRSLSYPWSWDDLHLVRTFTPSELVQGLTGTWDVDHIETPGYRPGTVLFNEARAIAFREDVVAHRVFVLGLFAVLLTLLARLAVQLGTPLWIAALGCLFALVSRDNWWNLTWPSDGPRVFACMLGLAAVSLFFSGLLHPARWKLPACIATAALAVLTREEPLALFPVMLVLGPLAVLVNQGFIGPWVIRSWPRVALSLLAVGVILVVARVIAVLGAPPVRGTDPISLLGWPRDAAIVLYPMGLGNLLSAISDPVHITWTAFLVLLTVAAVRLVSRPAQLRTMLWLFCAVVTCAPGVFGPRPNILILPIAFFGLALAEILGALLVHSNRLANVLGAVAILFVVVTAASQSMRAQEELHPLSLARMQVNEMMVYGRYAGLTTIPLGRQQAVEAELAIYGIYSDADFQRVWSSLRQDALGAGRNGPNPEGLPFAPPVGFLAS